MSGMVGSREQMMVVRSEEDEKEGWLNVDAVIWEEV